MVVISPFFIQETSIYEIKQHMVLIIPGTRPEIINLSPTIRECESRIHFYLLIEVPPRMPDMTLSHPKTSSDRLSGTLNDVQTGPPKGPGDDPVMTIGQY